MGFHSGFDSGSLFHHLRFSAKIRDIIAIFDDNLVTTTTKSQFHGDPGRFGSMRIRIRINTDTDTDSLPPSHFRYLQILLLPEY